MRGSSIARLEVTALGARRGRRDVLSGVALDVAVGEVVAIVGPNGAGKTTLLECIAGLCPAAGEIRFAGAPLRSLRDHARVISYMPDEQVLPQETTVARALALAPGSPLVAALGAGVLVTARGDQLSRGEAKRCQLAAALDLDRPVVLLDEPLGAFDPRQLRTILPVLRDAAKQRALVLTVHQMRAAELVADRIVLLAGGRIVATGTVAELRSRTALPDAPFDDVFLGLLESAPP